MAMFFENLAADDIDTIDKLTRLLHELRDGRKALLTRHGADDEDTLLAMIRSGKVDEHPAYEDYLGARSITSLRESIRADLKDYMLKIRLP